MTEQKSLTLPASDARWAIRAVLVAVSRDDVTPVLCGVHWEISDGKVRLIGTDRYRVHEAVIDAPHGAAEGDFLMHGDQARWLLANAHKPARIYKEQVIRITWSDPAEKGPKAGGRVAAEVLAYDSEDAPAFRFEHATVAGTFPPVRRLFPQRIEDAERVDEVALTPRLLTSLDALTSARGEPLRFVMPKSNDGRAQPVLVQNLAGTARALVQPNLAFEKKEWQG